MRPWCAWFYQARSGPHAQALSGSWGVKEGFIQALRQATYPVSIPVVNAACSCKGVGPWLIECFCSVWRAFAGTLLALDLAVLSRQLMALQLMLHKRAHARGMHLQLNVYLVHLNIRPLQLRMCSSRRLTFTT